MDLRQLMYFAHVVDLGGFSRAAAFLHVAQPALSRQVASLEAELETRLLTRNGRGVVPTESGLRLLGHARLIIDLFERAHEDMENARLGRIESIAIGMPGSLSNAISSGFLKLFRAQIPDAKVHILTGRSTQLQQWLLTGRLDMAVLFDAPNSPSLEIHHLFDDRLHLFEPLLDDESVDGPDVTLAEVAQHPLVITSRPNRVREILEAALARRGRKLLVDCELDSLETTFDLVLDGARTVASKRLRRRMGQSRKLRTRKIVDPELVLKVQIVRRTHRTNNQVVEAAFRILRDRCLEVLPS